MNGTASLPFYVYVRNTGTEAITFNSPAVISSNFVVNYDSCTGTATTLAAGFDCAIQLTFTPGGATAQTGTLKSSDSAGTGARTLSLSGTGVATTTVVAVNAATTDVSEQAMGLTSGYTPAFLNNYGSSQVVTIASGSITDGGTNFSIPNGHNYCVGVAVGPGASCYSYVQLNPTSAGHQTGTITFIETSGKKYAGTLNGYSPADVNSASITPSNLGFGSQVVGTASNAYSDLVTLYNTGNLPVTVVGTVTGTNYSASASSSIDFSLGAYGDQCSGTTVPPGGSCYFGLLFTPIAAGSRAGTLVFPVTYPGATKAVKLTATVTGRGIATTATVVLSQTAVGFGNQAVGTTSPALQVTSTNYSASDLPITSMFSV